MELSSWRTRCNAPCLLPIGGGPSSKFWWYVTITQHSASIECMNDYIFYSLIICTWEKLYHIYRKYIPYILPYIYRKYKLQGKQSFNDYSEIYPLMASTTLKPYLFVLLQSFQSFPCLQHFSQLFFTICCHLSNVISMCTLVMNVCNAGTLSFQRSDS